MQTEIHSPGALGARVLHVHAIKIIFCLSFL
jgi:hypothetical protein